MRNLRRVEAQTRDRMEVMSDDAKKERGKFIDANESKLTKAITKLINDKNDFDCKVGGGRISNDGYHPKKNAIYLEHQCDILNKENLRLEIYSEVYLDASKGFDSKSFPVEIHYFAYSSETRKEVSQTERMKGEIKL